MKRNNINPALEYLSLTMIISYFWFNNIFLVLIGIILSLYLINIDFIHRITRSINEKLILKKSSREINKNEKEINNNSINIKSNKGNKKLSLVESIEELGFIPAIDESDDINAA